MIKFVDSNCVKYTNKVINYNTALQYSIKWQTPDYTRVIKNNKNVTEFANVMYTKTEIHCIVYYSLTEVQAQSQYSYTYIDGQVYFY